MPLILMVGLPSSGKTTRAHEIQKYFTEHQQKEVILISDNEIISQMNVNKNILFLGNKSYFSWIRYIFVYYVIKITRWFWVQIQYR